MGIHKLTAGDGYTYLTRHVAGGDVDRVRGQDAADYYTAEGNPPGRWYGHGLTTLGLTIGDAVSEEQMRALFGLGMHPDAETIISAHRAAHLRPGMTEEQVEQVNADAHAAASLGRAFNQYAALEPFADRVAARLTAIAEQTGRNPTPVEVSTVKAQEARRSRNAVAGYDLVFTPVKSVSVLWGLHPDPQVRAAVRAAHEQAVTSALAMLEEHAAFTRTGHNGVAQVDTKGLVAVAFDHYDSRAGDPNLHTHLVLSNKIQGKDGKWRALDGRPLHHLTVAVSEHYNTTLQAALTESLGVKWVARWTERGARRGEPVWELEAVPEAWVEHYSSRRTAITARYDELVTEYRHRHGHDPYAKAAHNLARQATLETRQGKKQPRSLQAHRRTWAEDLTAVFGPDAVEELMATVAGTRPRHPEPAHRGAGPVVAPGTVEELAERVLQTVAGHRSTWTVWNVHAETERLLRDPAVTGQLATELGTGVALSPDQTAHLVAAVVAAATSPQFSISTDPPAVLDEPALLRRADGMSVFDEHAAARYTSQTVLDAEDRLLNAARTIPARPQPGSSGTGRGRSGTSRGQWRDRVRQLGPSALPAAATVPPAPDGQDVSAASGPTAQQVAVALTGFENATGTTLDEGQRALVTAFATDPRMLVAGIGPAGSGKTTAMRAYLHTLTTLTAGARLVPLATNSHSAAVLAGDLGVPAENLHKFLYEHTRGPHAKHLSAGRNLDRLPDAARQFALRAGDVVLLDEAGMAGTFNLDALVQIAAAHSAYVRLLGDPAQLSAVESGGALRLIASEVGAAELTTLHRFKDEEEAAATLKLRVGDSGGLDFYTTGRRIVGGSKSAMIESAYTAWWADVQAGKTSFLPAGTNADVAVLSARARTDRVTAGQVELDGVQLHDGNLAGRGDWIITRQVNRRLALNGGRDFVRNGDAWTVLDRYPDGSLYVEHLGHRGRTVLPGAYVGENVELLYATTAHRVQGGTVQTAHPLITDNLTREHLYVMLTRAMERTTLHVATHDVLPLDEDERLNKARRDPDHRAALEVLHTILASDTAERSATEAIRTAQDAAGSLSRLIPRYLHALPVLTSDLTDAAQTLVPADAGTHRPRGRYEHANLVGQALGPRQAERAIREPAWAALQTALTRVQDQGLDPAAVLGQVVNRRNLTAHPHLSETLARRIHRYLATAETHSAPVASGSLGEVRFLPPWVPAAPPHAHPYLPAAARLIEQRVTQLAVRTVAERPAWSHALGELPDDDAAGQEWMRQAGIVAAYREQHDITDNDPARPLGVYQEPGQPARPAYWDAAAAITTARQLAHPTRQDANVAAVYRISDLRAGRSDQQGADERARAAARNRAIAHAIAADTYLALPPDERARIVTSMITRRGNLWYGPTADADGIGPAADAVLPGLDEAAVQPAHAPQLHLALIEHGHLSDPAQHRAVGVGSPARQPALQPDLPITPRPLPPPMTPQPRPGPSLGL